jgi:hypothetical protein
VRATNQGPRIATVGGGFAAVTVAQDLKRIMPLETAARRAGGFRVAQPPLWYLVSSEAKKIDAFREAGRDDRKSRGVVKAAAT